jgi:choline dehydrogenase-like flavoprotein
MVILIIILIVISIIIVYISSTTPQVDAMMKDPDIIIVGGGVSGCVISRRLSEKYKDKKILLLEQGTDRRNERAVYRTENALTIAYSKPYSKLVPTDTENIYSTFATMLGGGSSHNYGLVVQGSREFYSTNWYDKFSITDGDMDGYMKNVYNTIDVTALTPSIDIRSRIWPIIKLIMQGKLREVSQGLDVFINLGPLRANDGLNKDLIESLRIGYSNLSSDIPIVEDYNKTTLCISPTQLLFIDPITGVRGSINRQYLPITYHNLEVRGNSEVSNLNLEELSVTVNGTIIKAKEKLVLSCGGIFTPYLLYKSGLELPTTLRNHYGTQMIMAIKVGEFASGPLAFLSENNENKRDWQILTAGTPLTNFSFLEKQGIDVKGLRNEGWTFITYLVFLLNPKNLGDINYEDFTINFNMFHKDDEISLIKAMKHLTKSFEYMEGKYETKLLYPSRDELYGSDVALLKAIKTGVITTEHHSCTMRSHINENMELKGYKNVHIVDASSFPQIPDGNTEFPSVLIGEIGADVIYRDI